MEKTKEQKEASKHRFFAQRDRAIEMLQTTDLYEFIDALKYTYGLSMRYKSINLYMFLSSYCPHDLFDNSTMLPMNKCLQSGILKPWNNTYYFDKEKAESLQLYLKEHNQAFINPFKSEIPN